MDLLLSRKFRVLVMGVALMLYILSKHDDYRTDWAVVSIAIMVVGYLFAVALEDGLKETKYP